MNGRRARQWEEAVLAPAAVLDFDGSEWRSPARLKPDTPLDRHTKLLLMLR
jgi:hypothetical protein